MVNVIGSPVQEIPLFSNVGVTVTTELIGDVPLFTAVNCILPELVPVPIPISVLIYHEYVVVPPVLSVLKAIGPTVPPLGTVTLPTVLT